MRRLGRWGIMNCPSGLFGSAVNAGFNNEFGPSVSFSCARRSSARPLRSPRAWARSRRTLVPASRRRARPAGVRRSRRSLAAGRRRFADIVDRVTPAVVSVKVKIADVEPDRRRLQGLPDLPPNSPFYRFFRHFGLPGRRRRRPRRAATRRMAQGSGFFISSDGYIVTNNHVVDHASEVDRHHGGRQDHAGQGDRRRQQDRSRASQGAGRRLPVRDVRLASRRGSATG